MHKIPHHTKTNFKKSKLINFVKKTTVKSLYELFMLQIYFYVYFHPFYILSHANLEPVAILSTNSTSYLGVTVAIWKVHWCHKNRGVGRFYKKKLLKTFKNSIFKGMYIIFSACQDFWRIMWIHLRQIILRIVGYHFSPRLTATLNLCPI